MEFTNAQRRRNGSGAGCAQAHLGVPASESSDQERVGGARWRSGAGRPLVSATRSSAAKLLKSLKDGMDGSLLPWRLMGSMGRVRGGRAVVGRVAREGPRVIAAGLSSVLRRATGMLSVRCAG